MGEDLDLVDAARMCKLKHELLRVLAKPRNLPAACLGAVVKQLPDGVVRVFTGAGKDAETQLVWACHPVKVLAALGGRGGVMQRADS